MPKEEWGVKRVCPETGRRFYDLNADPVVSPYTGNVVNLEVPGAKVRPADKEKKEVAETEEEVVDLEEDVDVLDDDSDDSDVDLGDDILDDDDDDTVDLEEIADVPAEDNES